MILKSAVANLLHGSGFLAWHRRRYLSNKAVVLMYHRVLDPHEISADFEPGMYVTTATFAKHLEYLSSEFELVDLEAVIAGLSGGPAFSRAVCAVTFDDGWQDNYTNAFPLLKRFGVPATVFLVTGQIGKPDMLTWDQVREMDAAGVRFASHTVTHRELTILTPETIEWELAESQRQLEQHVAKPSASFCYPKGYTHALSRKIAGKYYSGAVTTRRGTVSPADDRFLIPRIGMHNDVASSTPLFALRIAGLQ